MCSADFFPVTLQLWRDRAVLSKVSLVIIILLLLHSSTDGPHLSIPPATSFPLLYFHISLSSSVSPHCLMLSLQGADSNRERETARNKEMERKQKMTRIRRKQTDIVRGVEAEREEEERGVVFLSHLRSFVITCPLAMLIIAKCLCLANNQGKYV